MEVSNNKLSKKQIISLSVGVAIMLVLVLSATFSYFAVNGSNTATSSTIIGDIGGDTIGTISLSGGTAKLYLGITPYDMSKVNAGKIYYSSIAEGSKEASVDSAGKTTYTATLSGATSDEVIYTCEYEFSINGTGTMMDAESKGDIKLVVEGNHEETIALGSSNTISGTWTGIKSSSPTRVLSAYLKLENTNTRQNDLAGTNLSLTITNTKFDCYIDEEHTLATTIMALEGNGQVFNEHILKSNVDWTTLSESEYLNVSQRIQSGSSYSDMTDEYKYIFEDGVWSTVGNWNSDTYNIMFNVSEEAYYQVCMEADGVDDSNVTVYINSNQETNKTFREESMCFELGYLNANDLIEFGFRYYNNASVYLQKVDSAQTIDIGYRYEGTTVNNYVVFNNDEVWRIIGVEEGSAIGLESGKYYTKIIKEESLETDVMYDETQGSITEWPYTKIYQNLNNDYYMKQNNYVDIGLESPAKSLIASANWYYTNVPSNGSDEYGMEEGYYFSASHFYRAERENQSKVINNNVGLLYVSDFAFATLGTICHSENLGTSSYYENCASKNWLLNNTNQWSMVGDSYRNGYFAEISSSGSVLSTEGYMSSYHVRPVVYLDSNVKITNDGDGSEGNPFEIGL